MSSWQLHVKDLQGHVIATVTITNPQSATVLDLKNLVHTQDRSIPPYEQRLVSSERHELLDASKLSSYSDITDGCCVFVIQKIPFQVFLAGLDGKNYTLTIPSSKPQTYSVAHLKKLVQEKTGILPNEQRILYAGKELVDGRTLYDYNIQANSTLHLVARLRGGLASRQCVVTGVYTTSAIRMPCGHHVSRSALSSHCDSEIAKRKCEVCCPSCSKVWDMQALRECYALSASQLASINERLTQNFCQSLPGVVRCGGCGSVWSSDSHTGALCPSCAKARQSSSSAAVKLLQECSRKTIGHATTVPSIRACPRCGKLVEHVDGCKRVECDGCKTLFCFICLTIRTAHCSNYYPCPDRCSVAFPQTSVPAK